MTAGPGPVARARASLRALETLDRLANSAATPSDADLEALRGWAGWGPMAPAFAPGRSGAWKEIGERLEWLLPPDQLREAEQATPNAFYTPPDLAVACWKILRNLGFDRGRFLEPGCGAGAFLAAVPVDVHGIAIGVERDPVTARVARLLHPEAQIINERLQAAALPAHSVDAVIGNVPFGETPVFDPTAPTAVTKSLHNYCIWRSVRTLRPGGVAVLITSRYTMDARDAEARAAIATEADLAGAIRLPNDALAAGGTQVVTDILVLRRRPHEAKVPALDWLGTTRLCEADPDQAWTNEDRVNEWFLAHPDMVMGELHPDRAAQYGRTIQVVRPDDGATLAVALAEATRALVAKAETRGLTWQPGPELATGTGQLGIPQRPDGRKERSFHLVNGQVCQVEDGNLAPVTARGKELAELTTLIRLRDAALSLLDAEADHDRSEESLAPLRARLNVAYDSYATRHGPLNRATITAGEPDPETGLATVTRRRPRMGGFRQDPDYVTVLALEDYDDETGKAAKAAIFSHRVNKRPDRPARAESADEAIRLCLDAHGRLDLPTIARLLSILADEVPAQIEGLAYLDPATDTWVTAEEYLSGNVRAKLDTARAAAAATGTDSERWGGHIAALEKVQPVDLSPEEIRAKLGAPWIPPSDIREFAADLLGYAPTVTYLPVTAQWEVKAQYGTADTAAATAEWGTGRVDAYRLLELALNGKAPVVYDTIQTPDGETRVRNQAETILAEEKQRAIAARFAEWAWEDPQRCDRLCAEYNRLFNSVVPRHYDGSHLTFPGMDTRFRPYGHQRDMVHRIVSSPASLCPYPVGTGKTPVMFMAARKLKELGLARKPLIIVPNHLLEQTAREGKRLFPAARILMAAREDLADQRSRKLFAARCATGDWDAVVMTHNAFTAIPVHPRTEAEHLTKLAARYRQALTAEPHAGKRTVKQLAKMVDAFETRAKTLLDHRTDDGVYFEHLGADFLMVDESHYFKNLGLPARTDGFTIAASKRATDLDMKLGVLGARGERTAALFTGTPVSNSLLEMYVLQHYLQPGRLEELGLHSADAWAATFVEFQTAVEVTPDGSGFRIKRRPARFENVPELLTLFGEVADLRPPESFAVERPEARHHTVVIPASAELRAFVAHLAERADHLRDVDPRDDNMLKICSDGRKAALDLELVGIAPGGPSKADAVVANVARIYHATRALLLPGDQPGAARGGFQIVFCDLGTPDPATGTQVYGKIRSGLIAAGVPPGQIRFIHDAATDLQKAALFTECRSGKVAVLLGSTDKLGVGTNIQTRCIALHHVDAPWRPADVEQREGRALRPGNLNPAVQIFKYVTERSFDSFMWQALERKSRFIGQVLSGRPTGRDVDDLGDATLSFAEVKALATGNPLLLELAEANSRVTRLRQLATGHTRASRRLADSVRAWEQQIAAKTMLADACDRIAATARGTSSPAWHDHRRQLVPADEVAGHLAHLTSQALSSACYETVTWRGLRISVAAERQWRQITAVATISAGLASLRVDLNPAWTMKGQHWRIEKELTTRILGAAADAEQLRADIEDLRQRAADATRRIAEPFPQAAELETARARRDAIEQAIREAAAPADDSADVPAAGVATTAGSAPSDVGEWSGAQEVIYFSPATVWPEVEAPAVAEVPGPPSAPAREGGEPSAADGSGLSCQTPSPREPAPPAPALDVARPRQEQLPIDGMAEAEHAPGPRSSSRPWRRHPAALAQADWIAEPLFAVPASGQDGSLRNPRRAHRRRTRRSPAQIAARDLALQPALFEIPETGREPVRRIAPGQARRQQPRK